MHRSRPDDPDDEHDGGHDCDGRGPPGHDNVPVTAPFPRSTIAAADAVHQHQDRDGTHAHASAATSPVVRSPHDKNKSNGDVCDSSGSDSDDGCGGDGFLSWDRSKENSEYVRASSPKEEEEEEEAAPVILNNSNQRHRIPPSERRRRSRPSSPQHQHQHHHSTPSSSRPVRRSSASSSDLSSNDASDAPMRRETREFSPGENLKTTRVAAPSQLPPPDRPGGRSDGDDANDGVEEEQHGVPLRAGSSSSFPPHGVDAKSKRRRRGSVRSSTSLAAGSKGRIPEDREDDYASNLDSDSRGDRTDSDEMAESLSLSSGFSASLERELTGEEGGGDAPAVAGDTGRDVAKESSDFWSVIRATREAAASGLQSFGEGLSVLSGTKSDGPSPPPKAKAESTHGEEGGLEREGARRAATSRKLAASRSGSSLDASRTSRVSADYNIYDDVGRSSTSLSVYEEELEDRKLSQSTATEDDNEQLAVQELEREFERSLPPPEGELSTPRWTRPPLPAKRSPFGNTPPTVPGAVAGNATGTPSRTPPAPGVPASVERAAGTPTSVSTMSPDVRVPNRTTTLPPAPADPSDPAMPSATARFGRLLMECRNLADTCDDGTYVSAGTSSEQMSSARVTGSTLRSSSTLQSSSMLRSSASRRDDASVASEGTALKRIDALQLKAKAAANAMLDSSEASGDPIKLKDNRIVTSDGKLHMSGITMDPGLLSSSLRSSGFNSSGFHSGLHSGLRPPDSSSRLSGRTSMDQRPLSTLRESEQGLRASDLEFGPRSFRSFEGGDTMAEEEGSSSGLSRSSHPSGLTGKRSRDPSSSRDWSNPSSGREFVRSNQSSGAPAVTTVFKKMRRKIQKDDSPPEAGSSRLTYRELRMSQPFSKSAISDLSLGVDLMYGDMEDMLGLERRSRSNDESGSRSNMLPMDETAPFDASKFEMLALSGISSADKLSDLSFSGHRLPPDPNLSYSGHRLPPDSNLSYSGHRLPPDSNLSYSGHRLPPDSNLSYSGHGLPHDAREGGGHAGGPVKNRLIMSMLHENRAVEADAQFEEGSPDASRTFRPQEETSGPAADRYPPPREAAAAAAPLSPMEGIVIPTNERQSVADCSTADFSEESGGLLVGFGRRRKASTVAPSEPSDISSSSSSSSDTSSDSSLGTSRDSGSSSGSYSGSYSGSESSESYETSSEESLSLPASRLLIPSSRDSQSDLVSELSFGGASALMSLHALKMQALKVEVMKRSQGRMTMDSVEGGGGGGSIGFTTTPGGSSTPFSPPGSSKHSFSTPSSGSRLSSPGKEPNLNLPSQTGGSEEPGSATYRPPKLVMDFLPGSRRKTLVLETQNSVLEKLEEVSESNASFLDDVSTIQEPTDAVQKFFSDAGPDQVWSSFNTSKSPLTLLPPRDGDSDAKPSPESAEMPKYPSSSVLSGKSSCVKSGNDAASRHSGASSRTSTRSRAKSTREEEAAHLQRAMSLGCYVPQPPADAASDDSMGFDGETVSSNGGAAARDDGAKARSSTSSGGGSARSSPQVPSPPEMKRYAVSGDSAERPPKAPGSSDGGELSPPEQHFSASKAYEMKRYASSGASTKRPPKGPGPADGEEPTPLEQQPPPSFDAPVRKRSNSQRSDGSSPLPQQQQQQQLPCDESAKHPPKVSSAGDGREPPPSEHHSRFRFSNAPSVQRSNSQKSNSVSSQKSNSVSSRPRCSPGMRRSNSQKSNDCSSTLSRPHSHVDSVSSGSYYDGVIARALAMKANAADESSSSSSFLASTRSSRHDGHLQQDHASDLASRVGGSLVGSFVGGAQDAGINTIESVRSMSQEEGGLNSAASIQSSSRSIGSARQRQLDRVTEEAMHDDNHQHQSGQGSGESPLENIHPNVDDISSMSSIVSKTRNSSRSGSLPNSLASRGGAGEAAGAGSRASGLSEQSREESVGRLPAERSLAFKTEYSPVFSGRTRGADGASVGSKTSGLSVRSREEVVGKSSERPLMCPDSLPTSSVPEKVDATSAGSKLSGPSELSPKELLVGKLKTEQPQPDCLPTFASQTKSDVVSASSNISGLPDNSLEEMKVAKLPDSAFPPKSCVDEQTTNDVAAGKGNELRSGSSRAESSVCSGNGNVPPPMPPKVPGDFDNFSMKSGDDMPVNEGELYEDFPTVLRRSSSSTHQSNVTETDSRKPWITAPQGMAPVDLESSRASSSHMDFEKKVLDISEPSERVGDRIVAVDGDHVFDSDLEGGPTFVSEVKEGGSIGNQIQVDESDLQDQQIDEHSDLSELLESTETLKKGGLYPSVEHSDAKDEELAPDGSDDKSPATKEVEPVHKVRSLSHDSSSITEWDFSGEAEDNAENDDSKGGNSKSHNNKTVSEHHSLDEQAPELLGTDQGGKDSSFSKIDDTDVLENERTNRSSANMTVTANEMTELLRRSLLSRSQQQLQIDESISDESSLQFETPNVKIDDDDELENERTNRSSAMMTATVNEMTELLRSSVLSRSQRQTQIDEPYSDASSSQAALEISGDNSLGSSNSFRKSLETIGIGETNESSSAAQDDNAEESPLQPEGKNHLQKEEGSHLQKKKGSHLQKEERSQQSGSDPPVENQENLAHRPGVSKISSTAVELSHEDNLDGSSKSSESNINFILQSFRKKSRISWDSDGDSSGDVETGDVSHKNMFDESSMSEKSDTKFLLNSFCKHSKTHLGLGGDSRSDVETGQSPSCQSGSPEKYAHGSHSSFVRDYKALTTSESHEGTPHVRTNPFLDDSSDDEEKNIQPSDVLNLQPLSLEDTNIVQDENKEAKKRWYQRGEKKSKLCCIALLVSVIVAAIVVTVVLTQSKKVTRNNPSVQPPSIPQTAPPTQLPTPPPTIMKITPTWVQIGGDLVGEEPGDEAGFSVSASDNGRVIIGGRRNSKDGMKNRGSARIFQFDESRGSYVPIKTIYGEAAGDQCGFSVSMSKNGKRVAVGSLGSDENGQNSGQVRIYDDDDNESSNSWTLVSKLPGEKDSAYTGSLFGASVSLSQDGSHLAVGAPYHNEGDGEKRTGRLYVYKQDTESKWEQVGGSLSGTSSNDLFGWSVSLSADAQLVAVGAPGLEGSLHGGYVKVFSFDNGSNGWNMYGEKIDKDVPGDRFGFSVSLAGYETLQRVAIGAPGMNKNGEGSGLASVYEYGANDWTRSGDDLLGKSWGENLGYAVSMRSDATRIVVGVPNKRKEGVPVGQVQVVDVMPDKLVSAGNVDGSTGEKFGVSVAVSSKGALVYGGASEANRVRVYEQR